MDNSYLFDTESRCMKNSLEDKQSRCKKCESMERELNGLHFNNSALRDEIQKLRTAQFKAINELVSF